jgi:hypothetical protein
MKQVTGHILRRKSSLLTEGRVVLMISTPVVIKLGLQAVLAFVNRVLLEHSHAQWFTILPVAEVHYPDKVEK